MLLDNEDPQDINCVRECPTRHEKPLDLNKGRYLIYLALIRWVTRRRTPIFQMREKKCKTLESA